MVLAKRALMTKEHKDRWRTAIPPVSPEQNAPLFGRELEVDPGGVVIIGQETSTNAVFQGTGSDGVTGSDEVTGSDRAAVPVDSSPSSPKPSGPKPSAPTRARQNSTKLKSEGRSPSLGSSESDRSGNLEGRSACPPVATLVLPEETKASFFSRLLLANSWFVSLVLHLLIFILLSLVSYSIHQGTDLEIELAQMGDDQPALTLESFDSQESSDGSDLDAEIEQLLAADDQSAELDFNAESEDFVPRVSPLDEMGFDDASEDAAAALMSDENRRVGNGNDAEFFGIQATGRDFVFIVDSSGSMSGRRWRNAVRELGDSLGALKENQRFYVIFFDVTTHLMFQGQVKGFRKTKKLRMLNANEANLEKAKRWFARIKLGQQTQPRVSFDYGLSLNPDAIFFLTDGEFDDGTYEFLMEVAARSDRSPKIHTIAFGNPLAAPVLEEIARRFKGRHQFVR